MGRERSNWERTCSHASAGPLLRPTQGRHPRWPTHPPRIQPPRPPATEHPRTPAIPPPQSPYDPAITAHPAHQDPAPPPAARTHTPRAAGPADPATRAVLRTTIIRRPTRADLSALLTAPPTDRLILLPYDAAEACEPAIARVLPAPTTTAPVPIVIQSLAPPDPQPPTPNPTPFAVGPLTPTHTRAHYTAAVRECLRLIADGDAYQINLAHHLTAPFHGDALALYHHLAAATTPDHGGFLCWDDPTPESDRPNQRHAVVSLSPELFFDYDPTTRTVRTKPMKGTRPLDADPAELNAAEKDRAELNMIVDLMRNDLGRVAVPGSVRVTRPRDIEPHANSVWQATATVQATLRTGLTPADIVLAAFPPGSVTGAPKVRAAQIIRTLEPLSRGPYCGTLIRQHPDARITASVLIRTAHITGAPDPADPDNPHAFTNARLTYPVGAGIVADSDPDAEWLETLTKARALTDSLALPRP